jgi:neutral ceramidase
MTTIHTKLTRRQFTAGTLTGIAALSVSRQLVAAEPTLLAGAAETVVTPAAEGTFLIGPLKPSTGIHDDLYARALVLADGDTRVALVTLDYLGFDFAYNDVLVASVSQASGIPPEHIMINCSHTHNAPLTICWRRWEKQKDKPFHEMLPRKLAEITKRACDALQPARVRYLREPVQVGFNRRMPKDGDVVMAPNPQGAVLPWVDVLRIEDLRSDRIAVLLSHAAHPVIVHEASTLITADYPGFAVAALRKSRGEAGVFMFARGCGGNINGHPLQGGIDAATAAGGKLAAAVEQTLDTDGNLIDGNRLRVVTRELALPLGPPPPVAECEKFLANEADAGRKESFAELLEIARSGQPRTMELRIRVFALGDQLCILGLSHEMFAEYHQFVNDVSPFACNMVFAYTNGVESYVATEKDYLLGDKGGYEASPKKAALDYQCRLPLAPEAERLIKAGIVEALHAVKSA